MRKENETGKSREYRKLCIINHLKHEVYIEIVDVSMLDKNYAGEEENYIMDMFGYKEEDLRDGAISWEWFIGIYDYTDDELGLKMPDIEKINKI